MLEMRLGSLESDCVFRANDRMIFKLYLSSLQIDDLAEATLYPKVSQNKMLFSGDRHCSFLIPKLTVVLILQLGNLFSRSTRKTGFKLKLCTMPAYFPFRLFYITLIIVSFYKDESSSLSSLIKLRFYRSVNLLSLLNEEHLFYLPLL